MEVHTARFGTLTVDENQIIRFTKGILGFEGIERYVLLPHGEESPFMFLQAVDVPELAFVVTDPTRFVPGYQVKVYADDLEGIEYAESDEVSILAIVRVPPDPREMTANLLAPLVINMRNRLAKQVVQQDSSYSVRHRIARDPDEDQVRGAAGPSGAAQPAPKLVRVG